MLLFLTTREVADQVTNLFPTAPPVCEWQVRRLFENGDLPDPRASAANA